MGIIDRDALRTKMDAGERFTLVEVLPEHKYRAAHLPGAIHLEFDHPDVPQAREAVLSRAASILPDKDAEIVVYCAGNR